MKNKGFTLVEIMIVVAIIALLAAIAIPNLLRARLNANESAGISSLRTVSAAAISFRTVNTAYPVALTNLGAATPAYIDTILGCAVQPCGKQGYSFALTGGTNTFTATARPQTFQTTGVRSFFVDESGVIRWTNLDAAATVASTPLD
ncbi:MAG: prepilin-type N-terminal cleavage/methylation domain-containing protein [Candidatus Omnitrophica bacterium]|nr:prepilin-type N-terminal cleavage/methylation domain-containing protein [Candidatus Omnitrophota bacterium]